MKIFKVGEILKDLESHIKERTPFSLIRFGDGGIKFIHAILNGDQKQLQQIILKEGLPTLKILEIFELWGYYARQANYIDTPEVYFTDEFWPRLKGSHKAMSKKTIEKLRLWRDLYSCAEFDNENFCNPEINFLFILNINRRRNLLDVMKNKKICCITTFPKIKDKLLEYGYNIDVVKIVGQYGNHYKNSFDEVIKKIKETANNYDFWVVAAGELGRIYSGIIKEEGGRAIDIGFVIEYWLYSEIPVRLTPFLDIYSINPLMLKLKRKALKYKKFL